MIRRYVREPVEYEDDPEIGAIIAGSKLDLRILEQDECHLRTLNDCSAALCMLICPYLRPNGIPSMYADVWKLDKLMAIGKYWEEMSKLYTWNTDQILYLRELAGLECQPGWMEREHQDDIDTIIGGATDTEYSCMDHLEK